MSLGLNGRRLGPDHAVGRRRAQEDALVATQKVVDRDKASALLHKWEQASDTRAQRNTATRRVAELLSAEDVKLEQRRERLKWLLEAEDAQYMQEAVSSVETPLDREAKMRQRVKELREIREAERQQLAEDKKRQQFLESSEKIRALRQQQELAQIVQEREQQLAQQGQRQQQAKQLDAAFDQLWLADMQAKEQREQRDAAEAQRRTAEQQQVLAEQRAALAAARQRERELQQEEQQILAERLQMLAQEAQQKRERELRRQRQVRAQLSRSNQLTVQRRAEQARTELQEDSRLLTEALEASRGQAEVLLAHKRRIASELQQYHQYMQQVRAYEKERESNIDMFHRAESDQAMQRLIDKLNREQAARDQLMKEVMEVRRQQILEKLASVESEREEATEDAQRLATDVDSYQQLAAAKASLRREKDLQHAQQLLTQAEATKQLRAEAAAHQEQEARRLREMHEAYEAQLAMELQRLEKGGQ